MSEHAFPLTDHLLTRERLLDPLLLRAQAATEQAFADAELAAAKAALIEAMERVAMADAVARETAARYGHASLLAQLRHRRAA